MICDIVVKGARFEVGVQATRELLFQNEIYQAGQQRPLHQQANFLLQDCEVHSHAQAVEWVRVKGGRLQAQIADTMRPTLAQMGWLIVGVNVVDFGEVLLEDAGGQGRQDQSLIQIPKA